MNPAQGSAGLTSGLIVYTLRHGEREDTVNPRWREAHPDAEEDDPPLSERGRLQAKDLFLKFKKVDRIHEVYSSPYERTLETAETLLSGRTDTHINVEPGLIESLYVIRDSQGQNKTPGHRRGDELASRHVFVDPNYAPVFPTLPAEDPNAKTRGCQKRVSATVEHILRRHATTDGQTRVIVIVGHATSIAATHCYLTGTRDMFTPAEAALSKYVRRRGETRFKCHYLCDVSHLSDPHAPKGYRTWKGKTFQQP